MNSAFSYSPKTSIVVLCYNGLEEATRPCMESLLANTPQGACELIAVDNASSDGTPEYLKSLAECHPNVRIQLNEVNKGYAGGNNDGICLARGDHIVLLNNDTLVPRGWLDRLLLLLETRPEIGLVGPITNSAGNEQRIDLPGLDEANFEQLAKQYTDRQSAQWFTSEKLGFFCVAMRRSLVDEIGLLDDGFGIGMFEDDDYCIRAKQNGYHLAVAEDCFVFHKGSVSFKKLNAVDYAQIFKQNRDYFFQKHGKVWMFSDIAAAVWKKIDADLEAFSSSRDVAALERVNARRTGISGALSQLKEVESRLGEVGGQHLADIKLAEKQKHLIEISDWANGLKLDNQRLMSELKDKHTELMAMSDWASGMKRELDALASSRIYQLIKWAQKKST